MLWFSTAAGLEKKIGKRKVLGVLMQHAGLGLLGGKTLLPYMPIMLRF